MNGLAGENTLVLVVEADRALRTSISLALADGGYRVLEASNGWTGLRVAQQHPPAVLLLGELLPELCAEGVLAALSEAQCTRYIPVLAIGAPPDLPDSSMCAPDGVIAKPVASDQLLDEVARVVGMPRARASAPVVPAHATAGARRELNT